MLTQRMTKEILLVALRFDVAGNTSSLEANRETFKRVLKGLRNGDSDLALPAAPQPEILQELGRVEELWPVFESEVKAVAASRTVTPQQLEVVSNTNLPLLRVTDDVVKAWEAAARSHAHSLLSVAINLSGAQRMLSQKMAKDLYMIALDHDADASRRALRQSIDRFERVHAGLMSGDSELLLLPAPGGRIRDQLGLVHDHWARFRPMVEAAAGGAAVSGDMVAQSAGLNLMLLAEMDAAVGMYEDLQPRS